MTHARQTIRDGFVTTITGLTTTGSNVFNGQLMPRDENQIPCWLVYPGEETIATDTEQGAMGSNRTLLRSLSITCLGVARTIYGSDPVDDTLDTMLEELETAIGGGIGVADILAITITNVVPDYDTEADNLFGSIEVTFTVDYRTAENAPSAII